MARNTTPKIEEQPPEPVADEPQIYYPPIRTDGDAVPPPPTPGKGEVVLVIRTGADRFATGRDDVPLLLRHGTAVPESKVDELIDFAADYDVTIEKLEN